jgi:hypothetical protein
LCPGGTKVGDVVVIMYGGAVPYILRQREDGVTFNLVGECFVEDFMNGEAFEERSGEFKAEEEVFWLV